MVKVALCQTLGRSTTLDSVANMEDMIHRAVAGCSDLDVIVFPEYCYGVPSEVGAVPDWGVHTRRIADLAKQYNVNILAGSFARKAKDGKAYNTVYFYNRSGEIIGQYDKSHLCVAIGYDESKDVRAGDNLKVFETDFGCVGLMVCYELRFPEVPRTLVHDGADIIFCPAEFPLGNMLPPRTDHWDILVRSAALQNVTWMVACNAFGKNVENDYPFGRSMVVDPWGTVVAQCGGYEGITYASIDLEYQKKIRESVAVWSNRRPELYHLD